MDIPVDLETIRAAANRIAPYAVRTPVLTSHSLDKASGASVFLKCENFQKIGAFKFRGAMNAVLLLDESFRQPRPGSGQGWPDDGRTRVRGHAQHGSGC